MIALCSADAAARAELSDLTERLAPFAAEHVWAHWVGMILGVLDHEPCVAIEPETLA